MLTFTALLSSRSNFMRQQAMSSKMMLDRPVPINRLVGSIADSASPPRPPLTRPSARPLTTLLASYPLQRPR